MAAIEFDEANRALRLGTRSAALKSAHGARFLYSLWRMSARGGLTLAAWADMLEGMGSPRPDRTSVRRRLLEIQSAFERLLGSKVGPVICAPNRGMTVGPWTLRADILHRLSFNSDIVRGSGRSARLARIAEQDVSANTQLRFVRHFLIGDDLARNGHFVDAADTLSMANALDGASWELRCIAAFRCAKYYRRAGRYAHARHCLDAVGRYVEVLERPMREHVMTELAIQRERLAYDDQADPAFDGFILATCIDWDCASQAIDSRLLWQQLNVWASAWRRMVERVDGQARVHAFEQARRGFEAAIYWALASEDPVNTMNLVSNLGYLYYWASEYGLGDFAVEALDWGLMSYAYIERFEWPEEWVWGYVFLARLFVGYSSVRKHLKRKGAYLLNSRTPDREEFYLHAIALAERIGEPKQLREIRQAHIDFLDFLGHDRPAE